MASSIGFTNNFSIAIDLTSLIVILMIAFYSIRLLLIMKQGTLQKSWRYVSIGSFMFVFGVLLFALVAALPGLQMPFFVFNLGGLAMIAGGVFLMLGLRVQYKIFHIRLSYEKMQERTSDLT